jgi:hypothetical protein
MGKQGKKEKAPSQGGVPSLAISFNFCSPFQRQEVEVQVLLERY